MSDPDILYIGVGLVVSLLYAEIFGVAPGGIIVPGYLALRIEDPVVLGVTFAISLLAYFVVRVLATVMIIYGRRRTVLMLLVGFLLGSLVRGAIGAGTPVGPFEIDVIGYVIPGLIAIWMDRQGIVATVSAAATGGVLTRLSGLLILGI